MIRDQRKLNTVYNAYYNTYVLIQHYNLFRNNYNLVLMGPSGVGKTFIAAGLCSDALKKGYKAYFRTMEQIIEILKMKDITKSAGAQYKRLLKAHLLVIDDNENS